MTFQEASALIRRQGYVVVDGVVSPERADRLREAVLSLQAEDEAAFGRDHLYKIGQEGFVVNVGDRGTVFEDLINGFPLADIVDALLDGQSSLYLYQGVIVPPGGGMGAYPWKWHCDLYHVTRMLAGEPFVPGINVLLYVDDVNDRNGATWLASGSQGLDEDALPWTDEAFRTGVQVQVAAAKGSALVFNPLLWHCAGANHTDRARCAVKMLCVRDWMLPQMDYSRSIRPEVQARLTPKALRLIGYESRIARCFQNEKPPTALRVTEALL
jgi:ectoine hydroxylase-related dioxygenase (phytanoyl-CoA dioxygenase family)